MINPNDISSLSTDEDKKEQPAVGGLSTPMVFKAPTSGKGLGQVSFPAGTLVDEQTSKGMLANMEKLLERKPFEDFQTDLQKMYAWTKYDKEPMFRQLAEQEQMKDSQRYNIAQSITAMQAGQNQTKTLAESLGIPMGGQPAMGGQPGMGGQPAAGGRKPPYIEMLESLPSHLQGWGMTLLKSNQLGEFGKLVKENEFKRPELQKNLAYADTQPADRGDLIKRSILKDAYSIQNRIDPETGKTIPFTAPGAAVPSTTGGPQNISSPQGARNVPGMGVGVHNGIDMPMAKGTAVNSFTGGTVKFAGDANDGYGNKVIVQNPDGTSTLYAHLDSIGVKPGDTVNRNAPLGAAGQTGKTTGPHLHVAVMDSKGQPLDAKTYLAGASKQSQTATKPVSKEDLEQQQSALTRSSESFYKDDLPTIKEDARVGARNQRLAEQVLSNLEGNNFGPGTKLNQSFMEYAQLAGVKLDEKNLQQYVDNMGIETARRFMSASRAKQAMGSQFTAVESENWFKNFAGIDNTKQYLKNFYQLEKAGALVDQDLSNFLRRNKGREQEAYVEWQDSGSKDRIMQENVDAFKNGKVGKVDVSPKAEPAKIPAGIPENAKQAADGKYYAPDPSRKGKYLMFEAKAQ